MPNQPLGPTGLLAQSMTLPAGSQSLAMGGMGLRAQGMDGRKKGGAALVAEAYGVVTASPQTLSVPATSAVGDLAIIIASSNNLTWSLTGGTNIRADTYGAGYPTAVFSKTLTASDLSSGLSLGGGNNTGAFHVVVFRNVTNITSVINRGANTGSVVVNPNSPGFVKSAGYKGVFSILINRQDPTVAAPVGWQSGTIARDATTWQSWAALLRPPPIADNTATVWVGSTVGDYIAITLELT